MKKLFSGVLYVLLVAAAAYSIVQSQGSWVFLHGPAQGTTFQVKARFSDESVIRTGVQRILQEVDHSMSTWVKDSEISRFNSHNSTEPMVVSSGFHTVVATARHISQQTSGVFDITVKPLVDMYGFGPLGPRELPSRDEIEKVLPLVGYEKLILGPGTVQKTVPEMEIDLNGIAPGYTADLIAAFLTDLGVEDYLVDIGGEFRAKGNSPRNHPWVIGIHEPEENSGPNEVHRIVDLKNQALATSGNYRRYVESSGGRLTHTIHPSRGESRPSNVISASVIADQAMIADAWATAILATGYPDIMEVLSQNSIAAYLLVKQDDSKDPKVVCSAKWKGEFASHCH